MSTTQKPTYQPVANDGALWRCFDCGVQRPHSEVWYITLPNGWKGISCKTCLDADWLERATYIKEPV